MLLRKTEQIGAIAGVGASVIDCVQAPIFAERQPESVIELCPIRELSALEHLPDERLTAHARLIKIFVPERQILHGRQQACGAGGVEIRDAQAKRVIGPIARVAERLILYDLGVIVAKMSVVHAERFEEAARREFAQRLAAHALDDLPEQRVTGVAIQMLLAGPEI